MKRQFFRTVALLFATLALTAAAGTVRGETILHHVHGLAFTPDGKAIMVPAHTGLAVYRDGRWNKAPGPPHDFMGFSAVKDAIYSSGHPAPGSPLRNPLGLTKSTDGGKTWRQLGLSGESDFHLMAAGYRSNVVYVINPEPNSRMAQPGVYSTRDDGKTWKRGAAKGLPERIAGIAVHATHAGTVAMATLDGLYVSRDAAATFKRAGPPMAVTAAVFDLDGKHLYFAEADGSALHRVALDGNAGTKIALPKLERDFVLYIAQNPQESGELAIATRRRDVFLSADGGRSWRQIAREGQGL